MVNSPKPVVSPRLRRLLVVILGLTALLVLDSIYLSAVTFVQWVTDSALEDLYYQYAFLAHLVVGVVLIAPTLVFIGLHLTRAVHKENRVAIAFGTGLATSVLLLFGTGIALTRGLPGFELRDSDVRELVYWAHVILPILVIWLFILHRWVGPKIRWKSGALVAAVSVVVAAIGVTFLAFQAQESDDNIISFEPALAKLNAPKLLEPETLATDEYCASCHQDIHEQWQVSAHKLASFNNPAYAFTVNQTRQKVLDRDGDVQAARFCAGCHDPIPLFSGAFDDPEFDFVNHWIGQAGITCLSCHAIEEIHSVRGNADFVIAAPTHYPFALSENQFLSWINGLLIKGKPSFHKQTFLKPFHQTAEFCSTCHKVHLPEDLNHYKWLRGQNHYDSFLLSGFSGHSIASFYYPPKAIENCNSCHMPEFPSVDFGSRISSESGQLVGSNHQFPAANTALQHILNLPKQSLDAHQEILTDSVVVDIFGIRDGESINGQLHAPIRPVYPSLEQGKSYVLEVVLRSLTVGHKFTEGTADSNEVWLDVQVMNDDEVIGRSGGMRPEDGEVDRWSHFVNAYVIDREGNRIDERNAEDIFVKLYDNQIGPGSAAVVLYKLQIPEDAVGNLAIQATLNYRKFDTSYLRAFAGSDFEINDLPITVISSDEVLLQIGTETESTDITPERRKLPNRPAWLRWNDYGIGYLTKPKRGALRQAEFAFNEVEQLGRGEGNLNLARVYIEEGRLDEAREQLVIAAERSAFPWSISWFGGIIDMQNGNLDEAISKFGSIVATEFSDAQRRGFDFSKDYRLLNKLATTYFERSKLASTADERTKWLELARDTFLEALQIDPENTTAHYGLVQVFDRLSNNEKSSYHRSQHERYRIDDNARDRAVTLARQKDVAANHAAEPVVIYDLQREDAYGLESNP